MRKQRGFTLIELLIVIAIIGILAGIAIPSVYRARLTRVTRPFEKHFGVSLEAYVRGTHKGPSEGWLSPVQKEILRPLVAARIPTICADPTSQLAAAQEVRARFVGQPATTEPAQVAARLKQLELITESVGAGQRIADEGTAACKGARDAAKRLGLLPE